MGWLDRLFGSRQQPALTPRADASDIFDLTDPRVQEFLRYGGAVSSSGEVVTPDVALKQATAYRCVSILCDAIATLPLDLIRRVDARTREEADDHPLYPVIGRKPNTWQTPYEWKCLMMTCVLLRGNGYSLKVKSRGKVTQLLPLVGPMTIHQNDDLSLTYTYTMRSGSQVTINQGDLVHLRGLSLDGVRGISVLQYARQSVGLGTVMDKHASKLFRNGAQLTAAITSEKPLQPAQREQLRESLDAYRGADQENSYKELILEGYKYEKIGMTSVDAQLLGLKEINQYEVCQFFGVPPHMAGLVSKTTSWGSGIEQQGIGFVQYTLMPWIKRFEEVVSRDLLDENDLSVFCRINPAGLMRGDMQARYAGYATARQWGWMSANDVRALEDQNPIPGGDTYFEPLNMQPIGGGADSAAPPQDPGKEAK